MITHEQKLELLNKVNAVVNEVLNKWTTANTEVRQFTRIELHEVFKHIDRAQDRANDAVSQADDAVGFAEQASSHADEASGEAGLALDELNSLLSRFDD